MLKKAMKPYQVIPACGLVNTEKTKRKFGNQELACFIEYLIATDQPTREDENFPPSLTLGCANHSCSVNQLYKEAGEIQTQKLHSKDDLSLLLLQLSFKEGEVLFRLMGSDSVKVIAKKMKISPQSVASYSKIIYQKLHLNSRLECALFLRQNLSFFQNSIAEGRSA